MRSSSQLFLLCLLKFIVLCFGQITSSVETQYEYYKPRNETDFWDPKLNGLFQKNGDQWEFKLNSSTSNPTIEVGVFMDPSHQLEFTLEADDWNAVAADDIVKTIEFSFKDDKEVCHQYKFDFKKHTKGRIMIRVFVDEIKYGGDGTLDPSKGTIAKFLIDYEGNITIPIALKKKNHIVVQSEKRVLFSESAYFKVSITWKDLPTDFTISFPSSIFRAYRPVPPAPPPPQTTSTSAPIGSTTEVASAEIELWIIIVPCVVGLLIILGVAIGIGYYCHHKKAKKNKPPPALPSDATPVDIKVVPSNEVQKSVVPTMVNAPELPPPTKN